MADPDSKPIVIVGAGLAGLCCARRLAAAGQQCVLIDSADDVGGRVRTDRVEGFLLDRGFQVFNDAYPEAREVLDYEALDLKRFEPGALTRVPGKPGFHILVDPFRRPIKGLATAFSPAATLGDKWRVAKLRAKVNASDADALLREPEQTTMEFLQSFGFSGRIIESFFRPFFGGVFLDRSLSVSSRLFLWLFRMFVNGSACLPAAGMGSIPRQIYRRLKDVDVRLNTAAETIEPGAVRLADGTRTGASAIVLAVESTAAAALLRDHAPADLNRREPRSSTTLYFTADEPYIRDNLLLLSGSDYDACAPVNSVAHLTTAAPSYAPDGRTLISVSVVEPPEGDDAVLLDAVRNGLIGMFGSNFAESLRHLRTYRVAYSLPNQLPPELSDPHKPVDLGDGIYLCGDHRDTASINGAMLSGRRAAEAVLKHVGR